MLKSGLSQSQAEMLIQSVTDYAIYMLDMDGTVRSWNTGARRFKGYDASEIIGQNFSRFYTPEDRAAGAPQRALNTALTEGRFEAAGWRVRKDGSRFWANVVIDPIRDDRGRHLGFAKITRDLTERRQLEEALEQSREQFFQAQKMEAIGQLTGGVAHDFNNMLAAIMSSIGLARRRLAAGEDITPFLDNVMQAAERGKVLTQRMLAFARKQDLRIEPVNLIEAVQEIAELLKRTIGPNMAIRLNLPPWVPTVKADRMQLELALMNLAVNARDAMNDSGTVTIGAEQLTESDGARYVRLTVEDNGIGMDAETQRRAVEPFFTTKGVGKGTGLGLSMVQGMIEQCGGRFRIESTEGQGTTAELWLPVTEEAVQPVPLEAETAPATNRPLRILAVDDDAILLLNTAMILSDIGHEVLQAHSGAAALALLDEHEVDVLVTDFAMPGMTGGELVTRATAKQPGIKAVIPVSYTH